LIHVEHCEQGHPSPFVTNSSLVSFAGQRLRIYSASIATEEGGPWLKVGSFVYVDGNFRFMGYLQMEPNWTDFYSSYNKPFEN